MQWIIYFKTTTFIIHEIYLFIKIKQIENWMLEKKWYHVSLGFTAYYIQNVWWTVA